MSDATERGGSLSGVYRQIKTKDQGVIRLDRAKVLEESRKAAAFKGDGRNKPMANVLGPDKAVNPNKKGY